ncbi:MAG: hypothetical protein K8S00_11045 [Bacteroidales bacterium]|nr:hypothetical protein [Bacteroidales bacterium]
MNFDGSNDQVHVGNMGKRPESGSIQFWMKQDVIESYPRIFSTGGLSSNNQGITFLGNTGGLFRVIFGNDAGSVQYFTLTNSLTANTWYFVSVIWDETAGKVWAYMNDQLVLDGLNVSKWCTNFTDVRFGIGYSTDYRFYYDGKINEVRMWEKALTKEEVLENMNKTLTGYEPGLMGYWNFEQGNGTIAYDRSNNGFDGTLLGGTSWIASDQNLLLPWLTADTTYGTIIPGDSLIVNVTFNANGLIAGTYLSDFLIFTNDPLYPEINIPCELQITGSPGISFSDTAMVIDTTLVGATTNNVLFLTNTGCDTLIIDSISNLYPDITISPDFDTLLPGEICEFEILFSPTSVFNYYDTLLFYTNYIDTTFCISAISIPAPLLSYWPDSINVILQGCNDTLIENLSFYNTGAANLSFDIQIDETFYEDFESGLSKWTWTGNWGIETFMGTHVLTESPGDYYRDNWDNSITMIEPVLVTNKDSFEISFMLDTKLDYWEDYLILQFSINGGNFSGWEWYYNNLNWNQITYNLKNYVSNGDLVKFRFLFYSDELFFDDGVRIDDFRVKGVGFANPWISVTPQANTVAINDSANIDVEFTTSALYGGKYNSKLLITTNDPLNNEVAIPVSMMFIGDPVMLLSDNCLTYDSTLVGAIVDDTILINNTGCDTLFVTNVINSLSDFYVNYNSFFVPPGQSYDLIVSFNPQSIDNFFDTLLIFSNAGDTSICLNGIGIPAPTLIYDPLAFSVVFQDCDDSTSLPLTIKNTGPGDLDWELYVIDPNNSALWFDGINNYVRFGTWNAGNKWTLEAWVKPESVPSGRRNIVGGLNSCLDWAICMQNGKFGIVSKPTNGACSMTFLSDVTAQAGQWYHVAGTYTGNKAYIYVNGILRDSSDVYNYSGTTNALRIGGETCCSGNNFPGIIDEVRIWNTVRTEQQINAFMHTPIKRYDPNLLGYYTMDQGSGSTLWDDTPYGHTGIIYASWEKSDAPISQFLSIASGSGTLAFSDSIIVNINFNAHNLTSGYYFNELHLINNDPLNPHIIIPCSLEVIGDPFIELSENCLDMDSVMIGGFSYDTLYIYNSGCQTLTIDSITNIHPEFSLIPQSVNVQIAPYQTYELYVNFNPTDLITYFDTLRIFNDDVDTSICLTGTGIVFPVASIQPDSFSVIFDKCDDSTMVMLNVYNTGTAGLSWNIQQGNSGITDNFDPALNPFNWTSGSGVASSNCGYYSSPNALYFNGQGTRQIVSKSLSTFGGGTIEFYLKIGSGGPPCENADAGEEIILSYTIDGGLSWHTINTYSTTSFSSFTYINEIIPPAAYASNTFFRWRQISHSGSGYDNWALDDIDISISNYASFPVDSGYVQVGDSNSIAISISALGLNSGVYSSFINLFTNDPVNPVFLIPYQLTVNGDPIIELSDSCISFPATMIGDTYSDTVNLYNTGCEDLIISSIYSNLSDYNTNISNSTISPDNFEELIISFNPTTVGIFLDTLFIINNDVDTYICLSGQAIEAPIININPDDIDTSIICFDTLNIPIVISNSGPVDLNWQLLLHENINNLLILDGVNDYVNLGYWSAGSIWTLEAWAKTSATPAGRKTIVGGVNSCADWAIVMQDSIFGLSIKPSNGNCSQFVSSGVMAVPGQWYHIAGTNDGSYARIYVNGILRNLVEVDSAYGGTASYPYIGGSACCGNQYFPGSVDEVRIWNTVRSQGDIYNFMSIYLNGDEPGLVGYYSMDEESGTTIHDKSSSGHNGTIYNDPSRAVSDAPIMNYISTDIIAGTALPGDSSLVHLTVIRNSVASGHHSANLIINSNDPLHPSDTVFCNIEYPNNIILPNLGNDTIICLQDTITLYPGSYSSYQWSDGSFNSTLDVDSTAKYFVNVIDANGCVFSDTMMLNVSLTLPLADAGGDKNICSGHSTSLDGSGSGGTFPYQYFWNASTGIIPPALSNPVINPPTTTSYNLYVIDKNGCRSSNIDTTIIFVTPSPVIFAGSDTTISLGSIISMNASVISGIPPFSYLWSPHEGLNDFTILNPFASPVSSTIYTLQLIDSTGCSHTDDVTILIKYSLSGEVFYDNSATSPLNNTWVNLFDIVSNSNLDSVYTDINGNYIFNNLDNGNYLICANTEKTWGGVNATDALVVRRHIVGFEPLNDLPLVAADVNNTSSITSADALQILRRTIGLSSSFASGDWVFDTNFIFINNGNQIIDMKGLCVGDVNQSYNPSTKKSGIPSINLINDGYINSEVGKEVLLPVYLNKTESIGAITLEFIYPDNVIEIQEIISPANDLKFNFENNKLRIAWSNPDPIHIEESEALLVFKVRLIKESADPVRFNLGYESELADGKAKVLKGLTLKIPDLTSKSDDHEFSLGENYPNPFNNTTEIPYSLPEYGRVRLIIFNLLGEKLKVVIDKAQEKGQYRIVFNRADLNDGIYLYKLEFESRWNYYESTKRMIINK